MECECRWLGVEIAGSHIGRFAQKHMEPVELIERTYEELVAISPRFAIKACFAVKCFQHLLRQAWLSRISNLQPHIPQMIAQTPSRQPSYKGLWKVRSVWPRFGSCLVWQLEGNANLPLVFACPHGPEVELPLSNLVSSRALLVKSVLDDNN